MNFQFFSDSSAIVLASPHFLDSEADSIASNICFFYRQEDIEVREAVLPIPEQVTPETSSVWKLNCNFGHCSQVAENSAK